MDIAQSRAAWPTITNRHAILFSVFCVIVLSEIAWYDLRVYSSELERRGVFYNMLTWWGLTQFALFAVTLPALVRNITLPAWVWGLATLPYFIVGLIDHNLTQGYFINDIVRYALPLGWIVYMSWCLKHLSGRTVLLVIASVIAAFVLIRTPMHLLKVNIWSMRYGGHWELLLAGMLMAGAFFVPRRYLFHLCAAAGAFVILAALGQTRALLLGIALMAAICSFFGLLSQKRGWIALAPAAVAIVVAILPMAPIAGAWLPRLDITASMSETDFDIAPTDGSQAGPTTCEADLQALHQQWQTALRKSDSGLDNRIAESLYFLKLMQCNPRTFWLGAGAGSAVSVNTNTAERAVRGAHSTFVTLWYRHGVILGTVLILFVSLFGLRKHWQQLTGTDDVAWKVLLIALLGYRIAIIPLSQLHQGLFDDPIVWLSIVVAAIDPVPSAGGISDGKTRPL